MQLLLATSQWHTAHTRTCGWVHGTHMEPGPILGNWEQGRACFLGFLWLKSKNLGHHRKLNAGTIKQCRVISLSPSPQLRIFYKSNSHRAKFSAHRTPGVWLLWCWQSSFMLRREYLRGSVELQRMTAHEEGKRRLAERSGLTTCFSGLSSSFRDYFENLI